MAEKDGQKEAASVEDVLSGQIMVVEALITVLEKKGLLNRAEVMEEISILKATLAKNQAVC